MSRRDPGILRLAEGVYRLILRAYPREVRDAVGADMADCFRDLAREAHRRAGIRGVLGTTLRTLLEAPASILHARLAGDEPGPARPAPRPRGVLMEAVAQDGRFALRGFGRAPGLVIVAAASIALGVGATTTMVSLASSVLWQQMPVHDPDRLVRVFEAEDRLGNFSWANFRDLEDSGILDGVFVHDLNGFSLDLGAGPRVAYGELVSASYFSVLGLAPALGRFFDRTTAGVPEAPPVVVISHHLWQGSFGGDPETVGRTVRINGHAFTVAAVAPRGFHGTKFGLSMDLWVPLRAWAHQEGWAAGWEDQRGASWLHVVGRLPEGVDVEQANEAASVLAARLAAEYPETNRLTGFRVLPEADAAMDPHAGSLPDLIGFLAIAAAALVLLVACGNVASLLLARAVTRRKEVGLRMALGARRGRIVRQLLTESLLLAIFGGVAGVALAYWATGAFMHFLPAIPYRFSIDPRPDGTALVAATLATLTATVVFGLVPSLRAARLDLVEALRGDGRSGLATGRARAMHTVVVGMMALSFVTLVLAGLFVTSLDEVRSLDPGFETAGRLVATIDVGLAGVDSGEDAVRLYDELLGRVRGLPGVAGAAVSSGFPLADWSSSSRVFADDRSYGPDERGISAWRSDVSREYFETVGTDVVQGRSFGSADGPDGPPTVIVNRHLATLLWPGQDPVGRRIRYGREAGEGALEVVGVAEDGKYGFIGEQPRAAIFLPYSSGGSSRVVLTVHADGDPAQLAGPVREELRALAPDVPLYDIRSMETHVSGALWLPRLGAAVGAALATMALVLAAAGLFGVLSFTVGQRQHEMGIRMALGARRNEILAIVLRRSLGLTAAGALLGSGMALAGSGLLQSLLFGVAARNPVTFVAVAVGLAAVSVLASLVPAYRATRADPIRPLRIGS